MIDDIAGGSAREGKRNQFLSMHRKNSRFSGERAPEKWQVASRSKSEMPCLFRSLSSRTDAYDAKAAVRGRLEFQKC